MYVFFLFFLLPFWAVSVYGLWPSLAVWHCNAMQCNDDYGRRREPLCPHQLNKRMCIKLLQFTLWHFCFRFLKFLCGSYSHGGHNIGGQSRLPGNAQMRWQQTFSDAMALLDWDREWLIVVVLQYMKYARSVHLFSSTDALTALMRPIGCTLNSCNRLVWSSIYNFHCEWEAPMDGCQWHDV